MIPWQEQNKINAGVYVQMGERHGYKSRECRAAHAVYREHYDAHTGGTDMGTKLPEYLCKGNQGIHDGRKAGRPASAPITDGKKRCGDCREMLTASTAGPSEFTIDRKRHDGLKRLCKKCSAAAKARYRASKAATA